METAKNIAMKLRVTKMTDGGRRAKETTASPTTVALYLVRGIPMTTTNDQTRAHECFFVFIVVFAGQVNQPTNHCVIRVTDWACHGPNSTHTIALYKMHIYCIYIFKNIYELTLKSK